ncbi:hypothetical protein QAD02_002305 [Eretmocerus hayati]|uniref:Uncharacterized protein n=1 Tax=Eretmocerus hayati TaxID=131215 RepID=A0ACC2NIW8_9HYME|nr:hypothetical protein QAD02_002305 [Eretmocerus hayati]
MADQTSSGQDPINEITSAEASPAEPATVDLTETCFVCNISSFSPKKKRKCKSTSIRNLCDVSERRKDKHHLQLEQCDEIVVHNACFKQYSRESNIVAVEKGISASRSRKRKATQDAQKFEFEKKCIICGEDASDEFIKDSIRRNPEYKGVCNMQDESVIINLKDTLQERSKNKLTDTENNLLARLKTSSKIIDLRPRYHKYCYNRFFRGESNLKCGRPSDPLLLAACNFVVQYIERNSYECQFSLAEILDKYAGPYKKLDFRYIKDKVKNHFGDCMVVFSAPDDYMINLTRNADKILSNEWYKNRNRDPDLERKRIVDTAAKIILEDIRGAYYETDKYPAPSKFFEKAESQIPDTLKSFLNTLIKTFKKPKNEEKEKKWSNRVTVLSHSIIASVRPRSFVSPILVGLPLVMHKHHASRYLIDSLSHIGFCASYEETLLFEASVAKNPEFLKYLEAWIQCIFDNADHNTLTYDGRKVFHYLGGLLCITPASKVTGPEFIARLKTIPPASEIAELSKIPLVKYQKPATPGLFGIRIEKLPEVSPPTVTARDFLWFYRKKSDGKTASWGGFMEQCTKIREFSTSRIIPLPFIFSSPTDHSTLLTALLEADRKRKALGQDIIFVTMDQPLYYKSSEIKAHVQGTDLDLSGVMVRIGIFHAILSYLNAINYIMGGSGLKEAFFVVLAEGSTDQALSGKAYSRSVNGHLTVQNAIAEIIVDSMDLDAEERKFLSDLSNNIGTDDFHVMIESERMEKIRKKFYEKLMSLNDNGPTAQLWVQYFLMVELLKQLIQSERVGSWEDQYGCLLRMLPYYHASGHNLYVKSLHMYLQDMLRLKEKLTTDEYDKFVTKGFFTIGRSNKFRSGIFSDLTIEQILMKLMKTAGGLTHGRGLDESTITTWIATTISLLDISTAVEDFCSVSYATSDQHVELQSARISRFAANTIRMKQYSEDHPPFPVTNQIRSIHSGVVGNDSINCHKALDVGNKSLEDVLAKNSTFGEAKFPRKGKVPPLSSMASSVRIEGRVEPIKPLLIFQRLSLTIQKTGDIKTYLSTEMAPFPLSLFDSNVWNSKDKVSEVLTKFVRYVKTHYIGQVIVVFDGYLENIDELGTKSAERIRRQNAGSCPERHLTRNTELMDAPDKFLKNDRNKKKFIDLLTEKLESNECSTSIANEDADTLIVQTALALNGSGKNVVIVGEDIDLLVILNQQATDDSIFFLKPGKGNVPDRLYNSQSFKFPELRKYVAFIHALTGSDTTSCFYNQGKEKIMKMLTDAENEDLLPLIDHFMTPNATHESIAESGTKLIARMYGTRQENKKKFDLSELRFRHFNKNTAKKSFKLERLPPSRGAAIQHSYRVYHQVQLWLGRNVEGDATNWGWRRVTDLTDDVREDDSVETDMVGHVLLNMLNGRSQHATLPDSEADTSCIMEEN